MPKIDIKIEDISFLKSPLAVLSVYYKRFSDCGSYIDSDKVIWQYEVTGWTLKGSINKTEEQLIKDQLYYFSNLSDIEIISLMDKGFFGKDKEI